MFKIAIDTHWRLTHCDGRSIVPRLTRLLAGIQRSGTLAAACKGSGLTYRYAWGLLREGEQAFGRPLVESRRGRGARLTPLGERLAWADERINARLAPLLDSLATEVEVEIARVLSDEPLALRLQASHGFAVEALRRFLLRGDTPIELKYRDCDEALNALSDDECDLAGLHLPLGELEAAALEHYAERVRDNWSVVHVASRRQGLIVAPGNPLGIERIGDLARAGVRYVNRQSGSGTRLLFDLLCARNGVDVHAIDGYETLEFTHASVAAHIGSGMADAGLGLEVPARRFGLGFVPLATDRYFFLCREALLAEPKMARIVDALRDPALRAEIGALPGYDAARAGEIEPARNLFGPRRRRTPR